MIYWYYILVICLTHTQWRRADEKERIFKKCQATWTAWVWAWHWHIQQRRLTLFFFFLVRLASPPPGTKDHPPPKNQSIQSQARRLCLWNHVDSCGSLLVHGICHEHSWASVEVKAYPVVTISDVLSSWACPQKCSSKLNQILQYPATGF